MYLCIWWWVRVINATFNNISVISWRSVLLVEETGDNHRPAASHWQTLSHNVVWSTYRLSRILSLNVSGDRHGLHRLLYKSNYHTITTTMAPIWWWEIKIYVYIFKCIIYITDLACYTYFHWFFNPECQHIFGKQTGYIFQSPKTIKTWTTKHYASLNQWYCIIRNNKCIFTKLNAVFILKTAAWTKKYYNG